MKGLEYILLLKTIHDIKNTNLFKDKIAIVEGSLGAIVKLLSCELEVTDSNSENNLSPLVTFYRII